MQSAKRGHSARQDLAQRQADFGAVSGASRMYLPALLALSLAAGSLPAQDLPDVPFKGLREHRFESQCVELASVRFNPAQGQAQDRFEAIEEHPAGGTRWIWRGKLGGGGAEYEISFDDGPSCDPGFGVRRVGGADLGSIAGEHLVLPGNGAIYVIRRSNRGFAGREKWLVRDDEVVEAPQEAYYVGMATRALKPLKLRAHTDPASEVIAEVGAGDPVLVVLQQRQADGNFGPYLVRTAFGLLGWVDDPGYGEERHFEDLSYLGD